MTGQLTEFMREQMSAAWSDEAFRENASQAMSRSILGELAAGRAREADGAFSEPLLRRSAATLSYLASALSAEDEEGWWGRETDGRNGLQEQALRLARLWESLARLEGKTPDGHSLLNAAFAYELAGYQANAACLARRLEDGRPAGDGGLWRIAGTFLQRRFVRLGAECAPLVKEPDYDRVGDLPHALGLASAASSLSALAAFFLTGDRGKVAVASAGLARAGKMFAASGLDDELALVHGLRSLAAPMASRSTWSVLGDLAGEHFAWRRYLMLLARGPGHGPAAGRSVSEMWPSQRSAVERGLLEPGASKIVRMPTSSGKARIAEMCILQALTSTPGAPARCVYIAPYRALVAEVAGAMSGLFHDLGFTVSGLDGSYDDDPSEEGACSSADILVVTPEKLDLVLRARPGSLGDAALFVLDEGHMVGDEGRGLKMELLLARLRRRFGRARFVVLSAMISDDAMGDFASWLCGKAGRGAVIATEWRPTLQRHAMFEWLGRGERCMLTYEDCRDGLRRRVQAEDVIRRETYEHADPKTGRVARPKFPSLEKSETAAELALKCSPLGPVLVYAATKKSAKAVAGKLLHRLGLAAAAGRSMPEGLRPRTGQESRRSIQAAAEWLGPDHDVTRLLKRGIALYHGDLPDRLRQAVEEDSRDRAHAVIVATSALAQGASMPIRTVIVHSCRRYDEDARRSERIPAAEYWNMVGRAGRAGHETEGTVIHIVNTAVDRRDYDHYMGEREGAGAVESSLYKMLGNLAKNRISPGEVDGRIDAEVLGMLAEEGAGGSCEDMVGEVVTGTLAATKANGNADGRGMDAMCERFRAVARRASGLGSRRVAIYGGTGLGREGCEALGSYARENRGEVERILTSGSSGDAVDLALMVLDAAEGVPEMSGMLTFEGGDREALVRAWIAGSSASEAFSRSGGIGSPDGAARFVERSLGHYAPWCITAFTRIAAGELGLDPSGLPPRVRHLAGMVRYGLPAPEACWAMRLGVATKGAAVAMAADYGGDCNFGAFAEWLGRLGREEAAERYGPDSNAASAAAAASRIRANPLLREGRSLDEVLGGGAGVECAGAAAAVLAAARASAGDPLTLERDRDAAHDRNAILVHADGSVIGRVERDVAQYLAPEMDCGARIGASVGSVSRGAGGAVSIRMRLRRLGDGASGGGTPPPPPRHPLYKSGKIPTMDSMMYPMLLVCSSGGARSFDDLEAEISSWLGLSIEQRQKWTGGVSLPITQNKTREAARHLHKAGLLDKEKRGRLVYCKITQKGEEAVADPGISKLTRTYLKKNYQPYRRWVESWGQHRRRTSGGPAGKKAQSA